MDLGLLAKKGPSAPAAQPRLCRPTRQKQLIRLDQEVPFSRTQEAKVPPTFLWSRSRAAARSRRG